MTRTAIIEKLYTGDNFRNCINKMEPDHLREDLKQEVALVVCEWSDEKVIGLAERGELEFYVVRVILNMIQSNTSPFYKKFRIIHQQFEPDHTAYKVISNEGIINQNDDSHLKVVENRIAMDELRKASRQVAVDFSEREITEAMQDMAISEIDNLYWYDAELIRMYLRLGNFRAIEKETGIPFESCYKNIKKSLKLLKERAIEKTAAVFSKDDLHFIQNNKT